MLEKKPIELADVEAHIVRDTVAAFLLTTLIGLWSYWLLPQYMTMPSTVTQSLVFSLQWLLLPSLILAVAILMVSWGRRQSVSDSLGSAHSVPSKALAVKVSFLQNTLEQSVLLFGGVLIAATVLSGTMLTAIPAVVLTFMLGRIFFYIGYRHHPLQRTFGMVLTILPTLLLLFMSSVMILSKVIVWWIG